MLLFDLLGEFIYLKDAEALLLNPSEASLTMHDGTYRFHVLGLGARIDRDVQALGTDIKAVTLHQYYVKKSDDRRHARVVLDT